jgi:hypothetical protein
VEKAEAFVETIVKGTEAVYGVTPVAGIFGCTHQTNAI